MSELTVIRAIRRFCVACQGGFAQSVRDCLDGECALYSLRMSIQRTHKEDTTVRDSGELETLLDGLGRRPVRAVRSYCLACAGGRQDLRACRAGKSCALWPFRFGVFPQTFKRVYKRRHGPRTLTLPGISIKKS